MTTFREQYGPPASVSDEQLTLAIEPDANREPERRYTGRKAWEQDVAWGPLGFAQCLPAGTASRRCTGLQHYVKGEA